MRFKKLKWEEMTIEEKVSNLKNRIWKFFKDYPEIKNLKEVVSLEIIYDDLTHKIENIEGQSILEAALQNKLDVPYSCQGGVCSSCIARIKSGTAEMASNQILTNEEVEEGLVLTCQANATSAHLVVDYDDV